MIEQKEKKKRTAEDYAFIGGLVSFGLIFLMGIVFGAIEDKAGVSFGMLIFLLWILVAFLSFLSGLIALERSIKKKEKFKSYLKPCVGIFAGILVFLVILIPNFLRFNARANQSEAKQNLGAIYNAYAEYHKRHHTYPSTYLIEQGDTIFNCFNIAGWTPKGNIRYNYNCMDAEIFSPVTNNYHCPDIYTIADKDSFTIAACGNVDNDATVDVWTIDDAKHLRNVVDDVKK